MFDIKDLKKKAIPKRDYAHIGVRVDEELKARLDRYCIKEALSISTLLVALLTDFLNNADKLDKTL